MLALKAILQRGVLEEVVEHLARRGVPLALDDDAHAVAVRLVAQVGDAVDLAALDQVGDLLEQRRLVDLVGDGSVATIAVRPARVSSKATCACITTRPRPWRYMSRMASISSHSPVTGLRRRSKRKIVPPVGKSGPSRCSHRSSVVISGSSMSACVARTTSPRLCGGMLVAMPTAMPGGAVDEQVRQLGREHRRLHARAVVVLDEVDRVLVDVGQHLGGDGRHARLGVAHGRGGVAVDGAEVALAVDQRVAQREVLGQAHERVVDAPGRRAGGTCP